MTFPAFWQLFTKVVGRLINEKAHTEVTITLRDGQIQLVRINRTYSPENLPNV